MVTAVTTEFAIRFLGTMREAGCVPCTGHCRGPECAITDALFQFGGVSLAQGLRLGQIYLIGTIGRDREFVSGKRVFTNKSAALRPEILWM